MTTTTVTGKILDPSGVAVADAPVSAVLVSAQGAYLTDNTAEVLARVGATTATDGTWSLALTPNAEIVPVGTGYRVTRLVNGRAQVNTITVPVSGSSVAFDSIIVDTLTAAAGLAAGGALTGYYPNPTLADPPMDPITAAIVFGS